MGSSGDEMNKQFERRLGALRAMSFLEVRALPLERSEKVGKLVVSQWVTHHGESETWVVIQAYRPWILGVGFMQARGIKRYKDGAASELSVDELAPYS